MIELLLAANGNDVEKTVGMILKHLEKLPAVIGIDAWPDSEAWQNASLWYGE